MSVERDLLNEAIALLRERPCHRPECIDGSLTDPSHRICQQIRDLLDRADPVLGH